MKGVGEAAGIKDLCSMKLRTLIETENMCSPSFDAQSGASLHLGHSEKVRDKHYLLFDKRILIQSSNRLLFLFEEAGEADDGPLCEEKISTSSDMVSKQASVAYGWAGALMKDRSLFGLILYCETNGWTD